MSYYCPMIRVFHRKTSLSDMLGAEKIGEIGLEIKAG